MLICLPNELYPSFKTCCFEQISIKQKDKSKEDTLFFHKHECITIQYNLLYFE